MIPFLLGVDHANRRSFTDHARIVGKHEAESLAGGLVPGSRLTFGPAASAPPLSTRVQRRTRCGPPPAAAHAHPIAPDSALRCSRGFARLDRKSTRLNSSHL